MPPSRSRGTLGFLVVLVALLVAALLGREISSLLASAKSNLGAPPAGPAANAAAQKDETGMARKTAQPPSWLTLVKNAQAAFTANVLVLEDAKAAAGQTSFRGAGYRITAQFTPRDTLFGAPPAGPLKLQGETPTAPQDRLSLQAPGFPPDALRQTDYWEYAQANAPQQAPAVVLVLLSQPAAVRILAGQDDDLPQAVARIHAWLQLAGANQKASVYQNLSGGLTSPVAYLAGFELLMAQEPDLGALFERFNRLPNRPGAAIPGILDLLAGAALRRPQPEVKALALKLLEGWKTESDPAAISSYLLWFDANGEKTWEDDPSLRKDMLAQAAIAAALSFSGKDASQWQQQVRYEAGVLIDDAK